MNKKVIWSGLCLLLAGAMLLASCGSTTSTTTTATTTPATTSTAVTTADNVTTVLTVTEGSQVKTYTMAALQALPSVSGNGGYMGKGGSITGPFPYQGVALTTLLNAVGGISEGEIITLTSSDNYSQQLTYDQITSGSMLNYYDTKGNSITPSPLPTLTIIYAENGAALDSSHGPTELGALSSQNILTDGSLWAKMVVSITVNSATASTTTTTSAVVTTTTAAAATSTTTISTPATTTTVPVVVSTTPVPTTPVVLTVVNGSTSTTFSMAQLQQLQPLFANSGYIKGTTVGSIDSYVGVPVKTILAAIPGFSASNSVTISDPTGYSKTFTYAMIVNGTGFTVLDNNGNTLTSYQPVIPFIAYSKNGTALDSSTGPLYLAFSSGIALNQYTQSSLWIKNVVTITIIAAQ